ncbi:MAG: STY0301 family protein [Bdellovibrionota bacterium]
MNKNFLLFFMLFSSSNLIAASYDCPTKTILVSVFDGKPADRAELIPDNEESNAPGKTVWTFEAKKERSIWIVCNETTAKIAMAKELPKNVVSCKLVGKFGTKVSLVCQ